MMVGRPAAIVFAREPIPGRAKTRLIPILGPDGAASLADAFIRDALLKARAIGAAPIIIAADAPAGASRSRYFRALSDIFGARLVDQGRGDLGVRMARAIDAFANPGGAILFGTDTPSLPARMLKRSADLLRDHAVVLAPALDGGYYLIGVRGRTPDIFSGVRWGSAGLMAATLGRLRAAGISYALGPWWYDVDRPGDLILLSRHLKGRLGERWAHAMRLGRATPCPATAAILKRFEF
jgi:uncharacterized protein